nr:cutinase [Mobiluncus curtisii]
MIPVRDDENPQNLPFPPEAQSLLMRSAIAAALASKRLAEEKGVFRLTPSEWAELEASSRP